MDDIKIFTKNEKELVTLTQTIVIYSQKEENGIRDWKICHKYNEKEEKRKQWKEKNFPIRKAHRTFGEKEYPRYLGILKSGNNQANRWKKK